MADIKLHRLVLDLALADRVAAIDAQNRISAISGYIESCIESALERYDEPDSYLLLERMELNLEEIDRVNLEEKLLQGITRAIDAEMKRITTKSPIDTTCHETEIRREPLAEHEQDIVKHFLKTGLSMDKSTDQRITKTRVKRALSENRSLVIWFLNAQEQDSDLLKRILYHLDDTEVYSIIEGRHFIRLEMLTELIRSLSSQGGFPHEQVRSSVWRSILMQKAVGKTEFDLFEFIETFARNASIHPREFIGMLPKGVMSELVKGKGSGAFITRMKGIGITIPNTALLDQGSSVTEGEDIADREGGGVDKGKAGIDTQAGIMGREDKAGREGGEGIGIGAAKDGMGEMGKDFDEAGDKPPCEGSKGKGPYDTAAQDHPPKVKKEGFLKDESLDRKSRGQAGVFLPEARDRLYDQLREPPISGGDERALGFEDAYKGLLKEYGVELGERFYLHNAGIVLVAPFLNHFFKSLGFVENGGFIDQEIQRRAAVLLHYLYPYHEISEDSLVLNKLLCGLPINIPVPVQMKPEPSELEEIDRMIQSLIQYWSALKNTSVEAFKYNFLNRKALLTNREYQWHVHIKREGIDVLLNTLPWSIGTIKQPWMEKPLIVEW